jgi:hypothetical protein
MKALFPLERLALLSTCVAGLPVIGFSVKFYFPDGSSASFALEHYVAGLILASLVACLFSDQPRNGQTLLALVRNMLAFSTVVFLHFNFKLWAQLVNPLLFDDWYQASDMAIQPLVEGMKVINLGFRPLKEWLPNAYHDVFVFMFFVSFAAHAITRRGRTCLGELTTAIALVLSVGGIAYMLAPAWGPFVFTPDEDNVSFHIQLGMSEFQRNFVASAGQAYQGSNFISPLAAMPSLHIAHAWVLWLYAFRSVRWLGYVYLPLVLYILTEAVASRWHYAIDLLVGLCLAYVCVRVARYMHRDDPRGIAMGIDANAPAAPGDELRPQLAASSSRSMTPR